MRDAQVEYPKPDIKKYTSVAVRCFTRGNVALETSCITAKVKRCGLQHFCRELNLISYARFNRVAKSKYKVQNTKSKIQGLDTEYFRSYPGVYSKEYRYSLLHCQINKDTKQLSSIRNVDFKYGC